MAKKKEKEQQDRTKTPMTITIYLESGGNEGYARKRQIHRVYRNKRLTIRNDGRTFSKTI